MQLHAEPASGRRGPLWIMWGLIAVILLLPAVAMQFTREVAWTAGDFAAAAALLAGAGALYELVRALPFDPRRKAAMGLMLLGIVALVWAEGAVGVF